MNRDIYMQEKPDWMPDHNVVLDSDQLIKIGGRLIGILRARPWIKPEPYLQWDEIKKIVDLTKLLWHHFQQTRTAYTAGEMNDQKKLLERMADLLARVFAAHNCLTNPSSGQVIRPEVIDDSRDIIQQMAIVVKLELSRVTEKMGEFMRKFQLDRNLSSEDNANGRLPELSWTENPGHSWVSLWGEKLTTDYHTGLCCTRNHDWTKTGDSADERRPTPVADVGEAMELDNQAAG